MLHVKTFLNVQAPQRLHMPADVAIPLLAAAEERVLEAWRRVRRGAEGLLA